MTDRELLEAAAKAAGINFAWINNDGAREARKPGVMQPYVRWNPLTDDGDAFRLAVGLRMAVDCDDDPENSDRCAAIRRAIVRAAAEIGRAA